MFFAEMTGIHARKALVSVKYHMISSIPFHHGERHIGFRDERQCINNELKRYGPLSWSADFLFFPKTKIHPPRRVGVQYVSSPGRARTYNNSVNSSGVIDHVKVITTIVGTQDQATVCAERCAVQGQNLTNNAFSEMNYSS